MKNKLWLGHYLLIQNKEFHKHQIHHLVKYEHKGERGKERSKMDMVKLQNEKSDI